MKKVKKIVSALIAAAMILSVMPNSSLSVHAVTYDRDAAIEYAKAHVLDTPEIAGADCANFVSKCVTAGGISVSERICVNLRNALEPFATIYDLEIEGSDTSKKVPVGGNNAGKLSKGDVMFTCCEACRQNGYNYERHAVIFSGDSDENGYARAYAHTSQNNNNTYYVKYNNSTACDNGHGLSNLRAEVVHFNSYVSIPEGVYVFHCVRNPDRVLDIQGDSKECGANIQLYDALYNQEQKFRVVNMGDYYCIQSVYSGMWLDIANKDGSYSVDGCNIQLWNTNTSTEQKWVFEDAGDGNVYIHSLYGMYLDTGGPTDNNTNIQTYHFDGTTSQQWKLERVAPGERVNIVEGVYVLRNVRDTGKVFDIQYDSTANDANIQLFDNLYNQVQKFRIIKNGNNYNIQSVYSGMWLDIALPYNQEGSNIKLWYDNSSTEQQWIFEDAGDGNVFIRSLGGMYIDTAGGNTYNRVNVETFHFDGTTSQQWKLERVAPGTRVNIEEGIYVLHNVRDSGKVFDIQYDSTASDANIQLYDNLHNQVQKFRIIKTGNNYYIQSVYSGMWLDIALPYDQEGSNIKLWYANTNTEQQWIFEDAGNGNVFIHSLGGLYIDTAGGNTANQTNIETYHFDGTTSQQWRLHRIYTISYDANGGESFINSQEKEAEYNLTLTQSQPTKSGCQFVAWNTKADGTGTTYACGGTYSGNADLTLYAQWTPNAYTISLDPDGGTCGIPAITVYYNEIYGVLPEPVRDGFSFDGWFVSDGTPVTESTVCTTADDHTLTAHWTAVETPAALTAKVDSGAVVDRERRFVYGLAFGVTEAALREQYLDVADGYRMEIEKTTAAIGTGTVLRVIDDATGDEVESFTVVIFGDVTGDGLLNSSDVTEVRSVNAGLITYDADSALFFAADVTRDGNVNSSDVMEIRNANAGLLEVGQTI